MLVKRGARLAIWIGSILLAPAVTSAEYGNGQTLSLRLERRTRDIAIVRRQEILQQARAVPNFMDGKIWGIRLFSIRANSFIAALGFRNGDVLRSVDELSLDRCGECLEVLEAVAHRDEFSVSLERNRYPMSLRVVIVGDGDGLVWAFPDLESSKWVTP